MQLRLRERAHLGTQAPPSGALGTAAAGSDYFSSDKHYASLARRIVAKLRCGGGWVLITGDPPADPQALSEALGNVVGVHYEAVIISCDPELTRHIERTISVSDGARAAAGAAVTAEPAAAVQSVFVLDGFDRLSDEQIKEICKATLYCGQISAAGILLASLDFLARLERPTLHFLKEHLDAQFRVQEVGDDEAITFLHNQLLLHHDRRIEAHGFRRGILIGVEASAGVLAAGIGLFIILNLPAEHIRSTPESAGASTSISKERPILQPPKVGSKNSTPVQPAAEAETGSASATTSPSPVSSTATERPAVVVLDPSADLRPSKSTGESPILQPPEESLSNSEPAQPTAKGETRSESLVTPPPPVSSTVVESRATIVAHPLADLRSSASEFAALVRRGDAFLTSGDITSARLFYERAADAGSGRAALQLGATFDPIILGYVRAGSGLADPAQALSWYRRASDLGMVEAEERIKRVESIISTQDNRSR